ncbi:hypothetical protein [Aliagarivorans taiwanensis]|uniref:DHHA1 domain-containing protein n=1 Tax=Aliagarivorans taiwanensis TaxID=561966 RepID=UPI00040E8C55|nr:hypothetical protein [Aliagarivorans taiwanensis]
MTYIDVFNGDADGILALLQLRLAEPRNSRLVTGVKRDIQLLDKLDFDGEEVITVLDISMEKNQQGLKRALAAGAEVSYFDHHRPGEVPVDPRLSATIDMNPEVCTALLVDKHLGGQHHLWAITAAYGDNLIAVADRLSEEAGLSKQQAQQLKEFGTLINYNGYGASVSDLHYEPAELFKALLSFSNPFDVIAQADSPYHRLKDAYSEDMANAQALGLSYQSEWLEVCTLPNQPWSRRVSGVLGNELANQQPEKAHAVFTELGDGNMLVSLRAPLVNKTGADEICSSFATGGGRKGAAGINSLPKEEIPRFIQAVEAKYK